MKNLLRAGKDVVPLIKQFFPSSKSSDLNLKFRSQPNKYESK